VSNPEHDLLRSFKEKFPIAQIAIEATNNKQITLTLQHQDIIEIASSLRDDFGFNHPIACGAIDYPSENYILLIYYLMNPVSKTILFLRVKLDRMNPQITSLTKVWEAISFHEREAHEMFGIEFKEHSNLVPLLLSPDWKGGYPLRKDFKGEGLV
jgi:NADH-quinone oxidoreductase subunit C